MSVEAQRPNDFVIWIGRTRADEDDLTAFPVNPLRVGDRARRVSRIESNTRRVGRSGELVFVKVVHENHNAGGIGLVHEHQSAFRGAAKQQGPEALPALAETGATGHREFVPDPILLFRFLALMCNSHRIHNECRYAIGEEQYPALLVQGLLIAVLSMDLLQRNAPDAVVRSLEFKAVRPLYVGRPLHLRGCPEGDKVRRWASDDESRLAMTASAEPEA